MFSYAQMTTRNLGFISAEDQARLRGACVYVCGTGGMGGACLLALIRAGVERFVLADIDDFEVSNLNRQVFAFLDTIDRHKAEASAEICARINPEAEITVRRDDWPDHVEADIAAATIVVNGTDDLGASLLLYRTARRLGKCVVDAYAAPLPSVYVTAPGDVPHEERLGYPTVGTAWDALSDDQRAAAFLREAEWVVLNSTSRRYLDPGAVGDVVAGRRPRMSFAPMVILTGQLMAYEALAACMGRARGADNRGWFLNPYTGRTERPRPRWLTALLRPMVRRFIAGLSG